MTEPEAQPNLLRSVLKNAVSLTGGRILLALIRFAVALVIVQRAGIERFGEFALILSFILIGEWLSDFGLADIAVRQIAANPRSRGTTLGAFAFSKAVQCILAAAAMCGAIALLGYSAELVRSGLVAAAAIAFYGGVQVYRVEFRVRMTMERDVAAEVLAAVALLAAVWIATGAGASLEMLTACYVGSRALNLVAAAVLARGMQGLAFGEGFGRELRALARAALPLGLAGLMVVAYDAMDAIALSHWSTSAEVGIFGVSVRLIMLAVIAEQALSAAVFPVLASRWANDRAAFARTFQLVLDWGTVMACAIFCVLYASAHGLGVLFKHDPATVAAVLQLLAFAILARALVTLVSPLAVISGRLFYALWISLLVVAAKAFALTAMASQGAIGAATAYLIAEIGVGLVPTVILCQRAAGLTLDWSIALRAVAVALGIAMATRLLELEGSLLQGVLALAAFIVLATLAGAIRREPLRQLLASIARRHEPNV